MTSPAGKQFRQEHAFDSVYVTRVLGEHRKRNGEEMCYRLDYNCLIILQPAFVIHSPERWLDIPYISLSCILGRCCIAGFEVSFISMSGRSPAKSEVAVPT